MKRKVLGIVLATALMMSLGLVMEVPAGAQTGCVETLYLSDTLGASDGQSELFEVVLDDSDTANPKAILTSLYIVQWNHVDAIACTPDGKKLYAIDDSCKIGYYDLETSSWTVLGTITMASGSPETDRAAFDNDGTLYITPNGRNKLCSVDLGTLVATEIGFVKYGTATIDISGADIAFDAFNNCYLWNKHSGAPLGVYTFTIPTPPGDISAKYIGPGGTPSDYRITGMAIRGCGGVDYPLLVSDQGSEMVREIDPATGDLGTSYRMVKGGSDFYHSCGDMTVGLLAVEEEKCGDLIAGQHTDVGDVIVSNDSTYLYVTYEITEPDWVITETHLYVGQNLAPTTAPGQFPYDDADAASVTATEVAYVIPLGGIYKYDMQLNKQGKVTGVMSATEEPGVGPCDDVYIAAHAVVQRTSEICIDFENYEEKDEVSTVSTDKGPVNFYTTNRTPLESLSVGDTADLIPIMNSYPIVAEPDTSPPYDNIVGFTVVDTDNPYRDDWVKDDGGTGAGGMTLTDPQDLSQTPLLYHAYANDRAIVIDVSGVEAVQGLDLAAIDLDWTEVWYFMYFNAGDELVQITQVGPPTSQTGDGVAFAVDYANPVSKVAIWGGMNLGQEDRVGYAIDNVCVTSLFEETAWGYCEENGGELPGENWATYITYHVH